MEEGKADLKVYMLGKFSMVYGGRPVTFKRNSATKVLKLLQILLHYSGARGGISRSQLLEDLYGREEVSDAANNLRVTVHRLKKMLADTILPDYDYIQIEDGIYKWRSPMPTWVDVIDFSEYVKKGEAETNEAERYRLFRHACLLYQGDFLPELSGEDWVIINSVAYKKQFSIALSGVWEYLKYIQNYEEMLEISSEAVRIYPFDEWQAMKIEALMGLDRYKEAMDFYEETARMFFEELGISPSSRIMKLFDEMSAKMTSSYQTAGEIEKKLKEEEEKSGALYMSLPSFRDSYRLLQRILERNGQSAYLMVITMVDSKGRPAESTKKQEEYSKALHDAIQKSLRKGDSFTKYSTSQFLILLVGTNKENCRLIFERIVNNFSMEHRTWKNYLKYFASSLAEVESNQSRIRFRGNDFHWK
ncbi:AfsR/SARP family transcriptional regulator [Blautia sp. An81]|uniref:AfsR/SARP family transcriptional regulator n=1 Tax=Blautia sp. An81 TaxID=1965659 RepID=UPI000B37F2BF|nr:BTAD domain-containing putative transcriptional regulator [Blautia sp. An81]OUN25284.1 transcriptional regulator [Blautia sp. An81]